MNQYDHLKKNLRDYKVAVDKEKLWKNTSHAIPQKRKKRAALFLLSSAIVLSAIGYSYYKSVVTFSEPPFVNQEIYQEEITAPFESTADVKPDVNSNETSIVANTNKILVVPKSSLSKPVNVKSSNEAINTSPKYSVKQDAASISTTQPDQSNNAEAGVSDKVSENNTPTMSSVSEDMLSSTIHVNDVLQGVARNLHEDEIAEHHKDDIRLNPSLEAVAFLATNIEGVPVEARTGVTSPQKPWVKPAEIHHLSSIQVIQGIGLTTMSIQSLDPESNQLATQMSKTHQSLETFSTTVSGNLKLPLGFSVDAGVQYNQLNTKLEYQWTTTERYTQEGVSQIIIDQHGQQQSVIGNVGVTKYTNIQSTRFTSHENIDLVASLRKTIWNYRRSTLDVFAKGGYSLTYRSQGSLLNKNGQVETFTPADNPYSRTTPFVYGAGIQFQYRISPRLFVSSAMDYQRINYLYHHIDNNIQFRFATYNAAIGIGYSL